MPNAVRTWARTILVCLLFLALGVTQAASLLHQHEHGDSHCCDLCHSGHTPVIATPLTKLAAPSQAMEWREAPACTSRILTGSASHKSSRAPPVQSVYSL